MQESAPLPRIGLLACSVFESEIGLHAADATNIVATRWFEIGLHDRPEILRRTLQAAVEELDALDGLDAIALAYGLCGGGSAGLRAGRCPLVIPRAHDCITVFMGDGKAFAKHQRRCATCHYYTPGWNRARRVPGPDRLEFLRSEFAKQFDEDNAEFLLEMEREQWAHRDTAVYLDLGTAEADAEAAYARRCAEWLGWKFEWIRGDPALLRDLLHGRWDAERFQIVEPGCRLAMSADDAVMKAEPCGERSGK